MGESGGSFKVGEEECLPYCSNSNKCLYFLLNYSYVLCSIPKTNNYSSLNSELIYVLESHYVEFDFTMITLPIIASSQVGPCGIQFI